MLLHFGNSFSGILFCLGIQAPENLIYYVGLHLAGFGLITFSHPVLILNENVLKCSFCIRIENDQTYLMERTEFEL